MYSVDLFQAVEQFVGRWIMRILIVLCFFLFMGIDITQQVIS